MDIARFDTLDAAEIDPRHEVNDEGKLAMLTSDMDASGWHGRPVLVADRGEDRNPRYIGITGSHRVAAATVLGMEIPVVILPYNEDTEDAIDQARCSDDYDAVRFLGLISCAAAKLAQQEIDD